eukprot:Skav216281  [mRNA]  locus=scaffold2088:69829:83155:+ [translate_table: standard]
MGNTVTPCATPGGEVENLDSHVRVHDYLFPMYVVKVSDFLLMEGAPEPHHILKEKGLLHEWQPGMFVLFISHQWLGAKAPDPLGQQLDVLRLALARFIDKSLMVEEDITRMFRTLGNATSYEQVADGYLFLDWFAIPQITARTDGVNEDVTRSDAALAVQSIPAYEPHLLSTLISLRADPNVATISGQLTTAAWLSARPDHVRILSEPWRQILVGRCTVKSLVCRMLVGCPVGSLFNVGLVSLYFDDAHLTDWVSNGPSLQWSFGELNVLLGTPFAGDKRQLFASKGAFLGLDFDFTPISSQSLVTFWVRERLELKVRTLIEEARSSGFLRPSHAAKLYGMLNFLESGVFGRFGCGGLQSIKDRQYSSTTAVTPELEASFQVIITVLEARPQRPYEVRRQPRPRVLVASDAALEGPKQGSGGFLILWTTPSLPIREAFVAHIPDELYSFFSGDGQKIAQLELMMVAYALITRASTFRGRRGYWFIDNVASLMCLLRGRSDSEDLSSISDFIHVGLFALDTALYWEYIPSKSNWADPISRHGLKDSWFQQNRFRAFRAFFPVKLLSMPFSATVRVFQFL